MACGRVPLRTVRMRPVIQGLGCAWSNGIPRFSSKSSTSWKCCNSSMAIALSVPTRGCRSRYFSRFRALVAALRSRCAWSTNTAGRLASTFSIHDSGTFARHNSIRLWIVGQPGANFSGFLVVGIQLEHPRVVLAGQRRLAKLLGAEVGQRKVGAKFVRVCREKLAELLGGVLRIAAVLEGEGKVEAGVCGIGLERERSLVGDQCQSQIPRVLRGHAQIVAGVEVGRIGAQSVLVFLDRLGWLAGLVRLDPAIEGWLGLGPIARTRGGDRLVGISLDGCG